MQTVIQMPKKMKLFLSLFAFVAIAAVFTISDVMTASANPEIPATWGGKSHAIYTGPSYFYNAVGDLNINQMIKLLGRNSDSSWVFIWSDSGDGWVPAAQVRTNENVGALAVWDTPIRGAEYKPGGNVSTTDAGSLSIRTGPDWAYNVMGVADNNQMVKLLGRSANGHWVFIWSDAGDGWVPVSEIATPGNTNLLAVWNTPIGGAEYHPAGTLNSGVDLRTGPEWGYNTFANVTPGQSIMVMARSRNSDWLFIWSDAGDGWVPANTVNVSAEFSLLAVWSDPIQGAVYSAPASTAATGGSTANTSNPNLGEGKPTAVVNTWALNVRYGPSTSYGAFTHVVRDQMVKILARDTSGDWVFIWSDSGDGWVSADYLNTSANITTLPVWTNPIQQG